MVLGKMFPPFCTIILTLYSIVFLYFVNFWILWCLLALPFSCIYLIIIFNLFFEHHEICYSVIWLLLLDFCLFMFKCLGPNLIILKIDIFLTIFHNALICWFVHFPCFSWHTRVFFIVLILLLFYFCRFMF